MSSVVGRAKPSTRSGRAVAGLMLALAASCSAAPAPRPAPAPPKTVEPVAPKVDGDELAQVLPSGEWAVPFCAKETPEWIAARDQIHALRERLRDIPDDADLEPLRKMALEIIGGPCFEMARAILPDKVDFDSTASLRTWWEYGESFLFSFLSLPTDAELQERKHPTWEFRYPPTIIPTLSTETAPSSPLAPLLCSMNDRTCGAETAGWLMRANRDFADPYGPMLRGDGPPPDVGQHCATKVLETPPRERYLAFYDCVDELEPRSAALPHGRFKAPKTGWLVLQGRRGHYQFCDEVRAYDLASGAAYIARECAPLLKEMADPKAEKTGTTVGRLPVDAVREMALMTMLAPFTVEYAITNTWFEVPNAVTPRRPRDGRPPDKRERGWRGSWQSNIAWTWMVDGVARTSGTLRWPNSSNAGVDYADSLLRAVESSFEAGCAPAPLPKLLFAPTPTATVAPVDGSAEAVDQTRKKLEKKLRAVDASVVCKGRGR